MENDKMTILVLWFRGDFSFPTLVFCLSSLFMLFLVVLATTTEKLIQSSLILLQKMKAVQFYSQLHFKAFQNVFLIFFKILMHFFERCQFGTIKNLENEFSLIFPLQFRKCGTTVAGGVKNVFNQ